MSIPQTSDVLSKLRAGERPPASAMRVFGAPAILANEGASPDAKSIKVRLQARQRGPIDHPYWGRVWHDLSTMRSRSKVALDDTHDVEIGYARPVTTEYGLELEGVVITNPEDPSHPANRIAYNLRNGIPQEASIDFSGDYTVAEIPEGLSMPVNGMNAEGPCLVVQNWPLRACAICKEGADSSTQTTTFNAADALAPLPKSITTFAAPKEIMSEPITEPTIPVEAAQPVAEAPAVVEAPAATVASAEGLTAPDAVPAAPAEAAPVAPVVEAPPVTVAPETPDALALACAEIEALKLRLATLTAGAPAIDPGSDKTQNAPKTWSAALALIKAEKPWLADWQCQSEASNRFADLKAKINNRS